MYASRPTSRPRSLRADTVGRDYLSPLMKDLGIYIYIYIERERDRQTNREI